MRRFSFQFASLLNIRRGRRNVCLQFLAQILDSERELAMQKHRLEQARRGQLEQLRSILDSGTVDIDGASTRRFYAGRLTAEIAAVERNQDIVADQQTICRQALSRTDRDVKILEKLEEKHRAAFLYEEERRAQRELEDAWMSGRQTERMR